MASQDHKQSETEGVAKGAVGVVDPTAKPYVPIDTDRVDDLEHYALDKIRVRISYKDHTDTFAELNGLIDEVYTKDHAEFLRMVDGRILRLDQILNVETHSSIS